MEKTLEERLESAKELLAQYGNVKIRRGRKKKAVTALGLADVNPPADSCITTRARSRRFSIVTYIEPTKLRTLLCNSLWVQHFAFIVHDRDVNADGSPKAKHTHLLLYTYDAKTCSAIAKIFDRYSKEICAEGDLPENTLVQITRDVISHYRYFLHLDDVDKVRYDERAIVNDNVSYWRELVGCEGLSDSSKNVGFAIFQDVLRGTSTYELARRYGREYIINAKHYHNAVVQHLQESGGDINVCQ